MDKYLRGVVKQRQSELNKDNRQFGQLQDMKDSAKIGGADPDLVVEQTLE